VGGLQSELKEDQRAGDVLAHGAVGDAESCRDLARVKGLNARHQEGASARRRKVAQGPGKYADIVESCGDLVGGGTKKILGTAARTLMTGDQALMAQAVNGEVGSGLI
jgi:hypothetical protein